MQTKKIIFLSDMHLLADKSAELFSCNTYERFKKVTSKVSEEKPDAIILMGDLGQDGSIEAYQTIIDELKKFSCPIYSIPGNHDDITCLQQSFIDSAISTQKHFKLFGYDFLALNTVMPNEIYGELSTSELNWLSEKLTELTENKVILLMHHHPVAISTPLIDQYMLKNAEEFFNAVTQHKNVQLAVFGHVHSALNFMSNNINFLSCPATCYQIPYGETEVKFKIHEIGYRWLEVYEDKLVSGVTMIKT